MGKKIRVADYLSLRASQAGATHAFIVTGGGAMHLNDALTRNNEIEPVFFHHEQAAAMAAESYCRVSRQFSVLNVTAGPGGINALNGIYGAYTDSLNILVLSGQVKRETYYKNYDQSLRQLGDQEVDIKSMVNDITKYSTVLQDLNEVKKVIDKAIFLLNTGRPGPVWIDIPIDIQGSLIDPDELEGFEGEILELIDDNDISENTKVELNSKENINDENINFILDRLRKAKKPVIFAGNGVRISGMHDSFIELINILKIPVVTGWNAHDILHNDSEYYAGKPGTVGDRAGNFTVQNSDFLLVLGCRLNIRQVSYNWKSFAKNAYVVMVDIDQSELNKHTLNIDLKITGNLDKFIPLLIKKLKKIQYKKNTNHSKYLKWCKERVVRYPVILDEYYKQKKLNPYVFIGKLFSLLTDKDVIVTGNGSACVITFQAAEIKFGQRLFTNSGSASMGYDLPASIGACFGNNKEKVICLAGDGSIMMNLQELQTIIQYKLPIKIFILNNNGYASILQTQKNYFSDNLIGTNSSNGISFPDFNNIADAFKIESMNINVIKDFDSDNFKTKLNNNNPIIFNVHLNPDQEFSPKLTSRRLDDGTMVSPDLEDMSPFLSKEELDKNKFSF